jgi:hypothetical protein
MMKQKAGLGKKVSSIFDGVPLPNIMRDAPQAPGHAQTPVVPSYRPDAAVAPRPIQVAAPPPKPAMAAVPQTPRMMPSQPLSRPLTGSVGSAASVKAVSGNSWQQLIYKMFFSGNSETDARNRKTIAMVGLLSVAFFVIAGWTGLFSSSSAKIGSTGSTVATAAASSQVRIDWTPPEPYPANFRDPMQVGSVSKASNGNSASEVSGFGGFVVKSIVFSEDNPTAVINGQIVKAGKVINGATVTKINKDSVEFTANGKSWKQQVE